MPPVTYPDYAYSRLERFWASDEATFNVGVLPQPVDGVTILPGASVPMIAPEYVPSEERNPTPGVRATFQRKKKPSAFTLPMYLRLPPGGDALPSWDLFALKGFGRRGVGSYAQKTTAFADPNANLRFVAQTVGAGGNAISIVFVVPGTANQPLGVAVAGNTITVTLVTPGAPTVTTTALEVQAAIMANAQAAALIEAYLASGSTGSAVVAAGTFALAGGADTGQVVYAPDTFVEEKSFSLHQWMGNEMRHIRGCLINEITVALSGTTEGKVTFAGFGANEAFAGVTTLKSPLTNSGTQAFLTDARRFLAEGATNGDTVWLQIGDEIAELVTVVDYVTGEVTLGRGKNGSTAAAHAAGDTVGPYQPGPDPKPPELVASCMLGSVTMGTLALRVIDLELTLSNALEARLDEYGEGSATGYRRNGSRRISGRFRAYGRQSIMALDSNLERNLEEVLVVVAQGKSPAALGKATFTMQRCKLDSVSPAGDGPEFVKTYAFSALETNGNDELVLQLT